MWPTPAYKEYKALFVLHFWKSCSETDLCKSSKSANMSTPWGWAIPRLFWTIFLKMILSTSRKRWRQANSSILTATFYLKQLGNLKRVLKKQHIDDSKKTLRKTGLNKQNLSIRCLLYCKMSAVLYYELTWWVTLNLHSRITVGKNTPILMMIGQYWLLSVCW